MPIAPRTPAECFATLIAWLSRSVGAMSGGDRLSYLLIGQIVDRLRGIKQRFVRLAARIDGGRYAPRTIAPHRRAATPRRADPLPKTFGWLLPLVPDAIAFRAQLEDLFRDPAMAALMQAAPASLARPLRSLCRTLGAPTPPILATIRAPIRAPVLAPMREATPSAAPQATPPPQRSPRRSARAAPVVPARAHGPPHPA
jgi:hypothetical protein